MANTDLSLNTGLEELSEAECLELLATEDIGRIAVIHHGQPEIFPVTYVLDVTGSVVFRTSAGTKLASALNRSVTFEVDRIDRAGRHGWSVIVHGVAHHTDHVAPGEQRLAPWVPGRTYLVRIARRSISGRRLAGTARPKEVSAP